MTFTYTPSFPVEERSEPYVRSIDLGNFSQRSLREIQTRRDKWSLNFSARASTERNSIISYLAARNGRTPFDWTTPFDETAQFICPAWNVELDSCGRSTVTATFEITYVAYQSNLGETPLDAADFYWIPDFVARQEQDYRPQLTRFGDGYSQHTTVGINPQLETWTLQFKNRTNAERNAIRTYMRSAARKPYFTWETPLGVISKFVCKEWVVRYEGFDKNTLSLTFTRTFQPIVLPLPGYSSLAARLNLTATVNINLGVVRSGTVVPGILNQATASRNLGAAIVRGIVQGISGSAQVYRALGNAIVRAEVQGIAASAQVSYAPGGASVSVYIPGIELTASVSFSLGTAYAPAAGLALNVSISFNLGTASGGGGGVLVGDESAFWQEWTHSQADSQILLYEDAPIAPTAAEGAAYWSDWRPFDDEFFLYGYDAAASDGAPAYWNRWQSWTEDPPLLFEEST